MNFHSFRNPIFKFKHPSKAVISQINSEDCHVFYIFLYQTNDITWWSGCDNLLYIRPLVDKVVFFHLKFDGFFWVVNWQRFDWWNPFCKRWFSSQIPDNHWFYFLQALNLLRVGFYRLYQWVELMLVRFLVIVYFSFEIRDLFFIVWVLHHNFNLIFEYLHELPDLPLYGFNLVFDMLSGQF